MPAVVFENESYVGKSLSPGEEAILARQIPTFLVAPGSFYEWLLRSNWDKVRGAAMIAKDRLGALITGISAADSEIGFQKIRSGHIRRTTGTTETADNNWSQDFTAGNDYYVGYSTNLTTAVNIDKDALVLVLGAMFTQGQQPVVEELYPQIGGTIYPVVVLRDSWVADNDFGVRGGPIRPLIAVPKATALWQTRETLAGTNELVLLGITFGMGRYLRQQSYSSIST